MDKETFKLTIVNQFRSTSSAIRVLMYPRNRQAINPHGMDRYAQKNTFFASEFNLKIHVTHIPHQPGQPVFEVQFEELPQGYHLAAESESRNLSSPVFMNITYRRERVHYNQRYIQFCLESCMLAHEDYTFRKVNPRRNFLLFYEIAANSHDRTDLQTVFKEIFDSRHAAPNDVYIEFAFTPGEKAQLEKFLDNRSICSAKEAYLRAFEQPHYGRANTTMGQIIETLDKLPGKR